MRDSLLISLLILLSIAPAFARMNHSGTSHAAPAPRTPPQARRA
ncbi:hypothetical protein [Deinococcus peraridilitoris]|uniref:Uncharacterized protein n=1 Tax=Deinococcus peraridilitoris (strain DSM 19664 / LMG 22246 / CIP 109416 / KR-200) TaxID=937777 RepID=L0A7A7_DEIPD|nr:hypothetical protein [Deinococcus peraridilitoris]AFZ69067.1 hypothetical protein Deipe_3641 [Deinococcus peraridilitoris DSM 19664]